MQHLVTDAFTTSFSNEVKEKSMMEDAAANLDYPGDLCCRLYEGGNWRGSTRTFCLDNPNESQGWDMRDYGFNDKAGSWYCGKSVAYDFCDDPATSSCLYGNGESGAGTWKSYRIGHNDELTYLHMVPYDVSKLGAVTLYEHPDCTGTQGRYYAPETGDHPNEYDNDEMKMRNLCNDCVTSVLVPYGYSVELFAGGSFQSPSYRVDGK